MDLFCGTGSIGLTLAEHCRHVYGFEVAASSIADAKRNADLNHISNATFVEWDLTKVSASMVTQYPRPDIIVTGRNKPNTSLLLPMHTVMWHACVAVYGHMCHLAAVRCCVYV